MLNSILLELLAVAIIITNVSINRHTREIKKLRNRVSMLEIHNLPPMPNYLDGLLPSMMRNKRFTVRRDDVTL